MSDRLTVIARWYATEGDGVPWVVIQAEGEDGHGMHHAIAECGTRASAEMIARALNAQGAVAERDALRAAIFPFLRLDHDIGDEWHEDCERARAAYGGSR